MSDFLKNNVASLFGEVVSEFAYNHEVFGEKFYKFYLKIDRFSETSDIIPVTISERMIDVAKDYKGKLIEVHGQFRSYNRHGEGKSRLILSVFARELNFVELDEGNMPESSKANSVYLDGYICKEPVYRRTPYGREIADVMIAVNRPYSKSDYIPCIVWGRNARYVSRLDVGTHIQLEGRIQSREYLKKLDDESYETKTAYEVSVIRVDVVEESEE